MKTTRCIHCRSEFTDKEIQIASECPACGTKSIPCLISEDVSIKINWHELRVLTMWAEKWVMAAADEEALTTITAITHALEKQYPLHTPLTLSKEIQQLMQRYPELGTETFQEAEEYGDD